jgi:DNA repair exonuclease SbcCD nuclease subunit
MKIALITDTHWGIRNDNASFLNNNKRFLDEVFFKYIDDNSITTVVHLGDLVDRRKYININTARRLREDFLEPIHDRDLDFHLIAGNHDTYYKNTNEVNSLKELVQYQYPNFKIYDNVATTVEFDSTPILFIPWICDENRKATMEVMNATPAQIAMGHLELQGFEMYKGSMVSHGDDASLFDRFDIVMSGHYHHRSSNGHIFYLGSHAEFTWSDYNDPKGFHIFDTETRELTFIKNTFTMFEKVWYDDVTAGKEPLEIDLSYLKYKIVKIIVTNKSNPYTFDRFIDSIEKIGVLELQIVEDHLNLGLIEDESIVNEAEDTLTIFKKYIDTLDSKNINKQKLESKIVELYNEALTIE